MKTIQSTLSDGYLVLRNEVVEEALGNLEGLKIQIGNEYMTMTHQELHDNCFRDDWKIYEDKSIVGGDKKSIKLTNSDTSYSIKTGEYYFIKFNWKKDERE